MSTSALNVRASEGIRNLRKNDKYVNFFHRSYYRDLHAHPTPIDATRSPPPLRDSDHTWIFEKPHGSRHRLDPVEFSFWSDDKHEYLDPTGEQVEKIMDLYRAHSISFEPPFLIIGTDSPSLPDDKGMITLTVGCAPVIFISPQAARDGFSPIVTNRANGLHYINRQMSDPLSAVYQAIPWTSPSTSQAESILELLNRYCNVSALNFIWPNLIFEIDGGSNIELESLPGKLGGWSTTYHVDADGKGFWKSKTFGRPRNITPTQENYPKGDNTNYLEKEGIIGPGVRVEGPTMATTLGVRIKKGTEVRVTVANHGFVGKDRIFHPDGDSGDCIAEIAKRYPDNDWALAKIHPGISFSNDRIFDSPVPTRLLTREDIIKGEWYVCDGMTTGKVAMRHVGIRFLRGLEDINYVAPMANYHTASIYYGLGASGEADKANQLREGICGAAIIHEQSGGMAGFFQYQDTSNHCFAPALDKLVEEGWEIY